MRRFSILLLFFFSGVSALIYQVAWVRQATLVFGVSVYAYSTVLAAFMGGLALGSYLLRKPADRAHHPLRMYSLLQVAIAVTGLLAPILLTRLMPVYGSVARALPVDSSWVTVLRAGMSMLVLAPPAFLMGGTLPVMARALSKRAGQVGSDVGQLYAADTLGAAIGCALAGIFLLRSLGTQETVLVAVALNIVCALGAWALSRHTAQPAPVQPVTEKEKDHAKSRISPMASFVLGAYVLSGFAALGYEVVWARILAVFTLDAVFSFSIMLTTFLVGLTVGGWIGAWWTRRRQVTLAAFGLIELGVAISAILTLFVFERLPSLAIEDIFGGYSVSNVIAYEFLMGFLILFVPTVLLGLLFPIVVSLYTEERAEHVGARVGLIHAGNTAGAIAGSLATGFLLIPLLGLQATVVALALINLGIGVAAFALQRQSSTRWWLAPAAVGVLALVLVLALPSRYYMGFRQGPSEFLVFYDEGVESTVAVFDVPDQNFKVSFVNGRIEVPTDPISMRAFRLLGHLPPIFRPDAQRALMLSFGNGIATGSLDSHQIDHIDAVDLAAEQFEAAEIYWEENHNVLDSPRLHTHVEDGRNFLLQTPYEYDIITTDATHPTNTSSWALFPREFYESVDSRLAPNGVFVQWVPFHSLLEEDYKTILRTFQSIFPHATLWYTGGSHTLLLATPQAVTDELLRERLEAAAGNQFVGDELGTADLIKLHLAMDEEELHAYSADGRLVTDNDAYFLPYAEETEIILRDVLEAQAR